MSNDTRDIAVGTAAKITAHIDDCFAVRLRNEKLLDKIDDKITKITYILGVIILATHSADWVLKYLGH